MRPVAVHHPRYQWLDVSFVVHPARGASALLILPTVNRALMRLAARAFQQEGDPEGRTILVLLLDNAGWQRAKDGCVPPGIVLVHLPPSTPERSPAEPVARLLREAVAHARVPRLEAARARGRAVSVAARASRSGSGCGRVCVAAQYVTIYLKLV